MIFNHADTDPLLQGSSFTAFSIFSMNIIHPKKKILLVHKFVFCIFRKAVFWIRIERIRKFLGLQDPDLLVRGTYQDSDSDPAPSIIKQKGKQNLDFGTSF
jgi:hypothetical protein